MIGRGNQTYIYFDRFRHPDSFELTFLQNAQKHRLAWLWQITDFIEKQCSTVRPLKSAGLASEAPVKAPFSCPNNSLSIKFGLNAAQLTSTKGFCARLPALCMPCATNSLPATATSSDIVRRYERKCQ
jgi:hypothetical protein